MPPRLAAARGVLHDARGLSNRNENTFGVTAVLTLSGLRPLPTCVSLNFLATVTTLLSSSTSPVRAKVLSVQCIAKLLSPEYHARARKRVLPKIAGGAEHASKRNFPVAFLPCWCRSSAEKAEGLNKSLPRRKECDFLCRLFLKMQPSSPRVFCRCLIES